MHQDIVGAYASRLLKGAEIHYGITEKECLAVIWAIQKHGIYLCSPKFEICTDHSAFEWLMTIKYPVGRLARWAIYIQAYHFNIIHRPGKKHAYADAISRIPINAITRNTKKQFEEVLEDDVSEKYLDPLEDKTLLHFLETGKFIPGSSKNQCKRVQRIADHYLLDEDKKLWILKFSKTNAMKN